MLVFPARQLSVAQPPARPTMATRPSAAAADWAVLAAKASLVCLGRAGGGGIFFAGGNTQSGPPKAYAGLAGGGGITSAGTSTIATVNGGAGGGGLGGLGGWRWGEAPTTRAITLPERPAGREQAQGRPAPEARVALAAAAEVGLTRQDTAASGAAAAGGYFKGGEGGFGGGGGGGNQEGGDGGFGGGAGTSSMSGIGGNGVAGFAGGGGGRYAGGAGGGGGALGGAVFVSAGGTLTISGTASESGGSVVAGQGEGGDRAGLGFGAGIFFEGGPGATPTSTLTFGFGNQSIADPIDDLNGAAGNITTPNGLGGTGGVVALLKTGYGTLTLSGANAYTGGHNDRF